jgi:hypothetical protein
MLATDLTKYIHNPQLLDQQSVKALQQLTKDFPYFQSAHLLLSLASKKWDASTYQQSLKKTAIVASNRSHLFRLIHELEDEGSKLSTSEVLEGGGNKVQGLKKEIEVKAEEMAHVTSSDPDSYRDEKDIAVVETKQELDILKATEIATSEEIKPVTVEKKIEPEEILEKEIGKQVVQSFVEKEILKTPELTKPRTATEPENFGDWLTFLKKNNGQSYEEIEEQVNIEKAKQAVEAEVKAKVEEKQAEVKKTKQKAIIDKIIESNPGHIRHKEEQKFFTPDIKAKESLLENEHLVTETLARIYALQGNVNKAVRAYEILSLKNPQKSAYFASLIQKLKNNQ